MNNDMRWKQRFQNFEKVYLLLDEVMQMDIKTLNQLEKEGVIQRFEVLIELSWKTLKDYLENEGYDDVENAKKTIKIAFKDEIITDAEQWMEALKKRNLTSHTYNENILQETLTFLVEVFHPLVRDLYLRLKKKC